MCIFTIALYLLFIARVILCDLDVDRKNDSDVELLPWAASTANYNFEVLCAIRETLLLLKGQNTTCSTNTSLQNEIESNIKYIEKILTTIPNISNCGDANLVNGFRINTKEDKGNKYTDEFERETGITGI